MKALYCSGDSFTDKKYFSKDYNKGLTTCWPEILKENLPGEWKLYNNGELGVGNNFILRDFFNHIIVEGNPDLVCIAWSNSGRVAHSTMQEQLPDRGQRKIHKEFSFDPVGHYNAKYFVSKYKDKTLYNPATVLGEDIINNNLWENYMLKSISDWLTNIYIIQQYCESNNIQYIFAQAIECLDFVKGVNHAEKITLDAFVNNNITKEINSDAFIGWPCFKFLKGYKLRDLLIEHPEKRAFGLKDIHPSDYGHMIIADSFWKAYNDNYIRR